MSTDLAQAMSKANLADSSPSSGIPFPSSGSTTVDDKASNVSASDCSANDTSEDQFLTVDYDYSVDEQKTPLPSPRTRNASRCNNTISFPTSPTPPSSSSLSSIPFSRTLSNQVITANRKLHVSQDPFVPSINNHDDGQHNTTLIGPALTTAQFDNAATSSVDRPPTPPPFRSNHNIFVGAEKGYFDVQALSARRRELLAHRAKYAEYYAWQSRFSEKSKTSSHRGSTSASESGSSYEPSSWTSDGSSLSKDRVAAKLEARRRGTPEEREGRSGGTIMLYNDMLTETYSVSRMLGVGAFGRVMFAVGKEGEQVAIKVMHKAMVYRRSSGRERILNELHALKRATDADLSFVCPMLSAWADDENVYVVMPYLRENMLQRMERSALRENEVLLFAGEILHGVSNLHREGIIHRDIKLENIVFDANGHIALTDFGLARITDDEEKLSDVCMYDLAGTAGYWAPEVITVTSKHGYGWQVDIWAMGMVFFEMATNRTTSFYTAKTTAEIKRMMMLHNVPILEVEDNNLRNLLSYMLVRDPKARWPIEWLKDHPYFDRLDWKILAAKDYDVPVSLNPNIRGSYKGMRFSTFRSGRDKRFPNLALTPAGEIVHNRHAQKSFALDDEEPDAFSFSMTREYRKELMREFIRREGVQFQSRYASDDTTNDLDDTLHIPPQPPRPYQNVNDK